jgi:hypothetical protein
LLHHVSLNLNVHPETLSLSLGSKRIDLWLPAAGLLFWSFPYLPESLEPTWSTSQLSYIKLALFVHDSLHNEAEVGLQHACAGVDSFSGRGPHAALHLPCPSGLHPVRLSDLEGRGEDQPWHDAFEKSRQEQRATSEQQSAGKSDTAGRSPPKVRKALSLEGVEDGAAVLSSEAQHNQCNVHSAVDQSAVHADAIRSDIIADADTNSVDADRSAVVSGTDVAANVDGYGMKGSGFGCALEADAGDTGKSSGSMPAKTTASSWASGASLGKQTGKGEAGQSCCTVARYGPSMACAEMGGTRVVHSTSWSAGAQALEGLNSQIGACQPPCTSNVSVAKTRELSAAPASFLMDAPSSGHGHLKQDGGPDDVACINVRSSGGVQLSGDGHLQQDDGTGDVAWTVAANRSTRMASTVVEEISSTKALLVGATRRARRADEFQIMTRSDSHTAESKRAGIGADGLGATASHVGHPDADVQPSERSGGDAGDLESDTPQVKTAAAAQGADVSGVTVAIGSKSTEDLMSPVCHGSGADELREGVPHASERVSHGMGASGEREECSDGIPGAGMDPGRAEMHARASSSSITTGHSEHRTADVGVGVRASQPAHAQLVTPCMEDTGALAPDAGDGASGSPGLNLQGAHLGSDGGKAATLDDAGRAAGSSFERSDAMDQASAQGSRVMPRESRLGSGVQYQRPPGGFVLSMEQLQLLKAHLRAIRERHSACESYTSASEDL